MPAYVKFEAFIEGLCSGEHDFKTDTFKVALSNTAPDAANDVNFADVTEIAAGNGYTAGGSVIANPTLSRSGGIAKFTGDDVTFTGAIAPHRYAYYYNDSHPNKALIGYWDRGETITPTVAGDSTVVDYHAVNGIFVAS